MDMHVPSAVVEARQLPATQPLTNGGVEFSFSPQLRANFDKDTHALWMRWAPEPRPCFNPALLADIRAFQEYLAGTGGTIDCYGEEHPIEYVVLASATQGVFNLGGDLDLFK
ncbi:MAG: hypothetical protein ACREUP_09255, partial [Burkholderiales bacterium]